MADFDSFRKTLLELVEGFRMAYPEIVHGGLDEANLRLSYLDLLFEALGWDVRNTQRVPLHAREVVVEPPSGPRGRRNRPDYVFRVGGIDKLVCEAKRPRDHIERHYFQIQNYVYNLRLWVGVLSDFEHLIVFVVGAQPRKERPFDPAPGWRLHYQDFEGAARRIWDLLARENVATGSLERFTQSLPKVPSKAKQGWLLKPDRNKTVDNVFLSYLEEQRRHLAKSLHDDNMELPNGQARYWSERELNEGTQRIIDRTLFQRICEDRDIDIGRDLGSIRDEWEAKGRRKGQLWPMLVSNFLHLHRTFNGGIYGKPGEGPHFIDELQVSDSWLSDFIEELSGDDSHYLFSIIPVEILGSVYERFLGSAVQPDGNIEPKPEVRKAGGVYYTPQFIVDYIVENTIGKRIRGKSPMEVSAIKVLDPACGSGSFLLRAFERICEHHVEWYSEHPEDRADNVCYTDIEDNVRLTTGIKRNILVNNIFGVDLDPQAVEVTQMSLYLKILEDESRQTLERDHRLFPKETFLPDLSDNIKCGNSLIGPDCYDEIGDDEAARRRVNPFNWSREFRGVMKVGGFDAVIGNPPYIRIQTMRAWAPYEAEYLKRYYATASKGNFDIYVTFIEKSLSLLNESGRFGMILPHKFFNSQYGSPVRKLLSAGKHLSEIVHFGHQQVFENSTTYTCLLFLTKTAEEDLHFAQVDDLGAWRDRKLAVATGKVRNDRLGESEWNFMVGPGASTAEKLSASKLKLGDIADIYVGLQTSADNVFVMEFVSEGTETIQLRSKALSCEWEFEKDLLYPLVSGTDVTRYGQLPERQYILFPYAVGESVELISFSKMKQAFPKTAEYLTKNKTKLRNRENGKMKNKNWYGYIYLKNMKKQNVVKLCIPRLVENLKLTLDVDGSHFLDNVDVCGLTMKSTHASIDLKFLLGILNSRLMRFHFPYVSAPFRGGWRSANRQFISQLPMPDFDSKVSTQREREKRMIELVDRMLDLAPKEHTAASQTERTDLQRVIEETDRQIDTLVYELYGLSDAEIAIVERQTSR